jgi:hypothetical protein
MANNKILICENDKNIIKKYKIFLLFYRFPFIFFKKTLPKNLILEKIKQFNSNQLFLTINSKNFLLKKFDVRDVCIRIDLKPLTYKKLIFNIGFNFNL